ncbi:MAG: hypothetical protein KY468_04400 [Armatimonadetes bacterium]|nr:hypothetical protein [Armatimonadota bacterium]
MNRRTILVSLGGLLALTGIAWGSFGRRASAPSHDERVLAALRTESRSESDQVLKRLMKQDGKGTVEALLAALDGPEERVRARAARALAMHRAGEVVPNEMVRHMLHNPTASARLSCAIGLMSVYTLAVREGYIQALDDVEIKVMQIAAGEVGYRGGEGAAEALFRKLHHPSWDARLEICKALITLKAADARVVKELEAMSREPEAAVYDAEDDEYVKMTQEVEKELGPSPELYERWGKIGEILQQAREIASRRK